jgi:hypothetical protein
MKLRAYGTGHYGTLRGKRYNLGDTVRNGAILTSASRPTYPGKAGKVCITGRMGELYAYIAGLVVLDANWTYKDFSEILEDYGTHVPDGYTDAIADILTNVDELATT